MTRNSYIKKIGAIKHSDFQTKETFKMTINITVIITDIRTFIPIITTFKYFPKINSLSQIQLKSQKLIKSNSLSHLRHRHSKNSIFSHKHSVSQGKIVIFTIKIKLQSKSHLCLQT